MCLGRSLSRLWKRGGARYGGKVIPSIAVSLLKLGLAGPLAHPIEKKKVAAAELPHVTMKCSDVD